MSALAIQLMGLIAAFALLSFLCAIEPENEDDLPDKED
jgi:hypothetical protein